MTNFLGVSKDMLYVNEYLKNILPYKTASHKIWSVAAEDREKILKLDWNEATVLPSPKVDEQIRKLVTKGNFYNLYPSTENRELLSLLSKYVKLPCENIQYFASSDSLHEYIAKIFIGRGTKVVIQSPSYDNFRLTAEACGAKVYFSEVDEDFTFNERNFLRDLKKIRPSLVYIVNPNNPLGYYQCREYIESLLKRFSDTMFLLDEAYCEFSGMTVKDLVLKYKNILVSRTMSKAFGLANFRFGYLLSCVDNIELISKIRNPKNITTFAQEAVIGALSDIPYMENYVKEVCKAREWFYTKMKRFAAECKVYNSFANFVVLKCATVELKNQLFEYLLQQDIYVRKLTQSPILSSSVRITIGNQKQMQRVLNAICDFFSSIGIEGEKEQSKLALFDFCGTLVNFQTANAFVKFLRRNHCSSSIVFKNFVRQLLMKSGILQFLERKTGKPLNKMLYLWLLKGIPQSEVDYYASSFYRTKIKPALIPAVVDKMRQLKAQGYKIYLLSGGYDVYLHYFVREYNLDGCISSKISFKNGVCEGKLNGLDCMDKNKVILLDQYFDKNKFSNIVGFSDSLSDLPMLKWCDKGVVVCHKDGSKWAKKYNLEEMACL